MSKGHDTYLQAPWLADMWECLDTGMSLAAVSKHLQGLGYRPDHFRLELEYMIATGEDPVGNLPYMMPLLVSAAYRALPAWRPFAKMMLERAGYRCRNCGTPIGTGSHKSACHSFDEQHHDLTPERFVILCCSCHIVLASGGAIVREQLSWRAQVGWYTASKEERRRLRPGFLDLRKLTREQRRLTGKELGI